MYYDNRANPIEFHRLKVKIIFCKWTKVHQIVSPNVKKIIVINAVIRLSIS